MTSRHGGLGGLGGAITPLSGDEMMAIASMRGPEMRAYEPTLRDRVGYAIYDTLGGLGGLGGVQNRMRDEGRAVVDFIPVIGDAIGFDDAAGDWRAGNYGMAAAGLGLTAAGIVPGVGDAAASAGRKALASPFEGNLSTFQQSVARMFSGKKSGEGMNYAEKSGDRLARSRYYDLPDGRRLRVSDHPDYSKFGNDVNVTVDRSLGKIEIEADVFDEPLTFHAADFGGDWNTMEGAVQQSLIGIAPPPPPKRPEISALLKQVDGPRNKTGARMALNLLDRGSTLEDIARDWGNYERVLDYARVAVAARP